MVSYNAEDNIPVYFIVNPRGKSNVISYSKFKDYKSKYKEDTVENRKDYLTKFKESRGMDNTAKFYLLCDNCGHYWFLRRVFAPWGIRQCSHCYSNVRFNEQKHKEIKEVLEKS